jgi:hypothetical protein
MFLRKSIFFQSTWHYIPEERVLQLYICLLDTLDSRIFLLLSRKRCEQITVFHGSHSDLRYEKHIVFCRFITGIEGSNPTRSMDVYSCCLWVFCVCR